MTEDVGVPAIDHRRSVRRLFWGGVLISSGWLMIVVALLIWQFDSTLKLNEWGDFLAGVSAPLALLWLIIGYFQQGIELQQNTAALQLQYQELTKQVEETSRLVRHAERQAAAAEGLVTVTGASAELEVRRAESAAQPAFSYRDGHTIVSGCTFRLGNHGAPISRVRVFAVSDGAEQLVSQSVDWVTGDTRSITVDRSFAFPIKFRFEYTDNLGVPRRRMFVMSGLGNFEPSDEHST